MSKHDSSFAVLDCETTGLNTRNDRIIEVAVVSVASDGAITDEFVTLINPNRDIGARHVHGITAGQLKHAPAFSEIAGEIFGRLGGNVITGHNVRFDVSFLAAECRRMGTRVPVVETICTCKEFGGRLEEACDRLGVITGRAHSALDDARATAELLKWLILHRKSITTHILSVAEDVSGDRSWPSCKATKSAVCRSDSSIDDEHFLAKLVTRLHQDLVPGKLGGSVLEYEGLLDRVLEDRVVTADEAEGLYLFASEYGLSSDQVAAAHVDYLKRLAVVAVEDGILSDSEREDLAAVGRLLGCSPEVLDRSMSEAWERRGDVSKAAQKISKSVSQDLAGQSVCFTGELQACIGGERISRELAHELARSAGLVVKDSVTKTLDLLVLADPHSMSGKAKKARAYGTRILADAVFWSLAGVNVD